MKTTPVGILNPDRTRSENQFALLSTQIAKKYGNAWKVQVLNTDDPVFDNILWQFQNGKEKGNGTQTGLFKLERIILTPFDYLGSLIALIALGMIGWSVLSAIGAGSSSSRSDYVTKPYHQPSYGKYNNDQKDAHVTETHYDQYGNDHDVKFKKGDYSIGHEGGRTFTMNPDESYDSDDGNTHFDN